MAEPGDVVGLMCHADREGVYDWIAAHGGTADSPETLRGQGAGGVRSEPPPDDAMRRAAAARPGSAMSISPSSTRAVRPCSVRVSWSSPGSQTAACPGWSTTGEPSPPVTVASPLISTSELTRGGRVSPDDAAGPQPDRDQVRLRGETQAADPEALAPCASMGRSGSASTKMIRTRSGLWRPRRT